MRNVSKEKMPGNIQFYHPDSLFKPFIMNGIDFQSRMLSFFSPDTLRQLSLTSASNAHVIKSFMEKYHHQDLEMAAFNGASLYEQTAGGSHVCTEMHRWMHHTNQLMSAYYKKQPRYICTSDWLRAFDKNPWSLPEGLSWPSVLLLRENNGKYYRVHFFKRLDDPDEKWKIELDVLRKIPEPLTEKLNVYCEETGNAQLQRIPETHDLKLLCDAIDAEVFPADRPEINTKSLEKFTALLVGGYISVLMLGDQRHGRRRYPWRFSDLMHHLRADVPEDIVQAENDADESLRIGRAALNGLIPFPEKMDFLEYENRVAAPVHALYDNMAILFHLCAKVESERKINQEMFETSLIARRLEDFRKSPPSSLIQFEEFVTRLTPDQFAQLWIDLVACLPVIVNTVDQFQRVIKLIEPFRTCISENFEQAIFNALLDHFPRIIHSIWGYCEIMNYGNNFDLYLSMREKLPDLINSVSDFIDIFQPILDKCTEHPSYHEEIVDVIKKCFSKRKFSRREVSCILSEFTLIQCGMVLDAMKDHVLSIVKSQTDFIMLLHQEALKRNLIFEKLHSPALMRQIITRRFDLIWLLKELTPEQHAIVLADIRDILPSFIQHSSDITFITKMADLNEEEFVLLLQNNSLLYLGDNQDTFAQHDEKKEEGVGFSRNRYQGLLFEPPHEISLSIKFLKKTTEFQILIEKAGETMEPQSFARQPGVHQEIKDYITSFIDACKRESRNIVFSPCAMNYCRGGRTFSSMKPVHLLKEIDELISANYIGPEKGEPIASRCVIS